MADDEAWDGNVPVQSASNKSYEEEFKNGQ